MKRFVLFLPGGRVFRAAARNVSRPPGRKAVLETKVLWRLVGLDTANEHGLLDQRSAFAIGGRVFRAAARNVSRPPGRKAVLETKVLLCLVGLDMANEHRLLDQRSSFASVVSIRPDAHGATRPTEDC